MKDWKKVLVSSAATIRDTIQTIDNGALKIALVVDNKNQLLGTITDGDIRRGILCGISLDESVEKVMNRHPTTAGLNESRESIMTIMRNKSLQQIPLLGENGSVAGIELLENLIMPRRRNNPVLLMAGGLGSRLHPLTNDCPKPLLNVGSKPILEIILGNFIEYGFSRFFISVNYKAEMIEEYFGDGSHWGVEISYIRENTRMGTAGALSLLPNTLSEPIFVMNGDLLTKVNFDQLLNFHLEHESTATMCVREYDYQVPYGVVKIEKERLLGIVEKPIQNFFVSAGIYVLQPEVLDCVPRDTLYDMPTLFELLIELDKPVVVFPVREYWLDIGRMDDLERANGEFREVYSK